MIDWSELLVGEKKGLVVEGKSDVRFVEAFLDAGQRSNLWTDWRIKLIVKEAGGYNQILKELDRTDHQLLALVDRDWRTEAEIAVLQGHHPNMSFLPRIMLENYLIEPSEVWSMIVPAQRERLDEAIFKAAIQSAVAEWLHHGALNAILYEQGAFDFCRGSEGYPKDLLTTVITDEGDIRRKIEAWQAKLDPNKMIKAYQERLEHFQQMDISLQAKHCINGKMFFAQVIVAEVLNRFIRQADESSWRDDLLAAATTCPPDLVEILTRILDSQRN